MKRRYLSKDGKHVFEFEFVTTPGEIEVYCHRHPGFGGQDPDPRKTHLFASGKLCFVSGKAPQSQSRAEQLAAQWAEYAINYARTGQEQA